MAPSTTRIAARFSRRTTKYELAAWRDGGRAPTSRPGAVQPAWMWFLLEAGRVPSVLDATARSRDRVPFTRNSCVEAQHRASPASLRRRPTCNSGRFGAPRWRRRRAEAGPASLPRQYCIAPHWQGPNRVLLADKPVSGLAGSHDPYVPSAAGGGRGTISHIGQTLTPPRHVKASFCLFHCLTEEQRSNATPALDQVRRWKARGRG